VLFMDIFTTQLARVVPVPIKPAKLKVKALLKDAGAGKLKEDLDHLENHDYYFNQSEESIAAIKEEQEQNQGNKPADKEAELKATKESNDKSAQKDKSEEVNEVNGIKHLDLYV